jgi:hypothetical protein
MPTFNSRPSRSLTDSVRRLIASGGPALSPLQEMQADSMAADVAHKQTLAWKAREEVMRQRDADAAEREEARRAQALRSDPQRHLEIAADFSGASIPAAHQLLRRRAGEMDPNPQGPADAADNVYGNVPVALPEGVTPLVERAFRNVYGALAADQAGKQASDPLKLAQAASNLQEQDLVRRVQELISRGDYLGASAASQGSKPGQAIKLHENIGNTGATFAPATGAVAASPTADPTNALLAGHVDSLKASSERDRAAAAASRAQADKARREGPEGAKPPPGYRWKADGTLEAIPGGPADIKAGAEAAKAESRLAIARGKADIVIREVDKAIKQTGFLTSGALGEALGKIPGRAAYDLRKTITTIKANIGFQELQAMREASPTGGPTGGARFPRCRSKHGPAHREPEARQAALRELEARRRPGG